jgi:Ca2+-binding EF-hand superfamily protein
MREIEQILHDETKLDALASAAFSAIDTDGSGAINDEELFVVLCQVAQGIKSEMPTLDDVVQSMSELDLHTDGLITFAEFKAIIVAVLQYILLSERQARKSAINSYG